MAVNISGVTPNSAVFSLHEMIASLLGIFMLVTLQPFGIMAFSLGKFHKFGVALCWHLSHLHSYIAQNVRSVSCIHHLAVERRWDDI